jgi:hypothetical protein
MGLVAMTVITAGFAFSHHHGPAPTPAATFTAQGETRKAHDVERVADDLDAWRTADPVDPVAGGVRHRTRHLGPGGPATLLKICVR